MRHFIILLLNKVMSPKLKWGTYFPSIPYQLLGLKISSNVMM